MDWISVEDKLPEDQFRKYLVKKENSELIQAFFMPDKMIWLAFYGQKTSYWMEVISGKLVHDVTHWIEMCDSRTSE